MVELAVVGAGIMGANHVRTARALREWNRVVVVDSDLTRAQAVAGANGFRATDDFTGVLGLVDAVIVAVPSVLHVEVATTALRAGKHVFVEKPLADTLEGARELAAVASESPGKVLVGHIERYNSAVVEILNWASEAMHVEFRRVGPKGSRALGDVVSDLMVHDLEIFLALAGAHAQAHGLDPEMAQVETTQAMWANAGDDLCTVLVKTRSGLSASFVASRVGQSKHRSVILTGKDVQVVGDLVRQAVSIYRIEHVEFVDERGARYRQRGTTEIPFLDSGEPLLREQRHFAEVVMGSAEPRVGVEQAIAAIELVERVRDVAGPSPLAMATP